MIFKRKSFHLFRNIGEESISTNEVEQIERVYRTLIPLCPEIKTAIRIVPAAETTCKRGQQYCILLYRLQFRKLMMRRNSAKICIKASENPSMKSG